MLLLQLLAAFLVCAIATLFFLRLRIKKGSIAFFHPFTLDGGGGERVLWCAVRAVQAADPNVEVWIYSGDDVTAGLLASRAADTFGTPPLRPVRVVRVRSRALLLAKWYPVLTLLGQALGSVVVTAEALARATPEAFVDTAGYAFGYPLARLAGSRVCCYVHYPMVSTDMLSRVRSRAEAFNNRGVIARSRVLSAGKVGYYRLLAGAYGAAGRCAQACCVNSSWTLGHIRAIWGGEPAVVFPPCNTSALQRLPLRRAPRASAPAGADARGAAVAAPTGPSVISVAQFRPEKNHRLQLEAWADLKRRAASDPKLAAVRAAVLDLVGGVRGSADAARLDGLRALAVSLGVADSVRFHVGAPHSELVALLGCAAAGIHTMTDEHFGIGVVEYMAAGAVPIAHRSGGPQADIVATDSPQSSEPSECSDSAGNRSGVAPRSGGAASRGAGGSLPGRLAATAGEFAEAMAEVLSMTPAERDGLAGAARARAARFSDENFEAAFVKALRL